MNTTILLFDEPTPRVIISDRETGEIINSFEDNSIEMNNFCTTLHQYFKHKSNQIASKRTVTDDISDFT